MFFDFERKKVQNLFPGESHVDKFRPLFGGFGLLLPKLGQFGTCFIYSNSNQFPTTIPFSTANTKFPSETTNTSTFKRWPKSAFQTVASRSAEKPIWAAPAGSQHFPVQQPRQKVLKDSTKHNMNITLTIDGKSMGSRSTPNFKKNQQQNVANTQNSNSGRNNKSKFQSEYSSKFKTPGQFV